MVNPTRTMGTLVELLESVFRHQVTLQHSYAYNSVCTAFTRV